jgi:prepilin-type N-terminal cleavage/methylation domain-containing protein
MHSRPGSDGFTLIEILIVVAIIAILASVVLVGLGPTQQAGRDARRISDLSEVQNGLELYYNKNGNYPDPSSGQTWSALQTLLTGAGVGVSSVPSDPSSNRSYQYWWSVGATSYVLGATLENANNSVLTNYTSISVGSNFTASVAAAGSVTIVPTDCAGKSDGNYCITL